MPKNQNCEIWQHTIETYYCVYYEEVAAEILINYWQLLDEFSKIIIAITKRKIPWGNNQRVNACQ